MGDSVIFFGWNRSVPGREQISAAHFQEFLGYLGGLQEEGTIDSFETVFLGVHGGDLNGFFLIRGEITSLDEVVGSEAWLVHMTRAGHHLEGAGAVRGSTGAAVMDLMQIWIENIPG